MNKREEIAARAAAMLEAGEAPKTAAAACGYKTVSGMLGAISLIRNRKDAQEATQEKPVRSAAEINPDFERAVQSMIDEAEEEAPSASMARPTLEELLEQKRVLDARISCAQQMAERAKRMIVENARFRVMRGTEPGTYVVSNRAMGYKRIVVARDGIDDLADAVDTLRAEIGKRAGMDAGEAP